MSIFLKRVFSPKLINWSLVTAADCIPCWGLAFSKWSICLTSGVFGLLVWLISAWAQVPPTNKCSCLCQSSSAFAKAEEQNDASYFVRSLHCPHCIVSVCMFDAQVWVWMREKLIIFSLVQRISTQSHNRQNIIYKSFILLWNIHNQVIDFSKFPKNVK